MSVRPRAGRQPDLARLARLHGTPLLVVDCAVLRAQYRRLAAALPGVRLYYALKPLPHPSVVRTLGVLGAGFDVATTGEIDVVRAAGHPGSCCLHTHPIKKDADIRAALRRGVRRFVVDNADEIVKFRPHRRRAELLLRVSFRNPTALIDLSRKFGCEPGDAPVLLGLARTLGIRVRGLSFHVGSQVADADTYVAAIESCAGIMERSAASGTALDVLDIGGGFPIAYGTPVPSIERLCAPIRRSLRRLPAGIDVLAEPGRYLAGPAGTCVCSVVGRARRDGRWWYYLDDGIYGTFSGQVVDHVRYPVDSLGVRGRRESSVLAGPTCDSYDIVGEDVRLPPLAIGDLVVGRMMGAYTAASATDFNFVPRARIVAVNERQGG
ncbi:MAG: type III PLP-dependent enzyme [Lysobacterales bacterium]|nr:MAG: type III PLP-dependent enzyme [Xanthomonadales bacterium]